MLANILIKNYEHQQHAGKPSQRQKITMGSKKQKVLGLYLDNASYLLSKRVISIWNKPVICGIYRS